MILLKRPTFVEEYDNHDECGWLLLVIDLVMEKWIQKLLYFFRDNYDGWIILINTLVYLTFFFFYYRRNILDYLYDILNIYKILYYKSKFRFFIYNKIKLL